MPTIKLPSHLTGLAVAKRAMFLAYQASDVVGLGAIQAVGDAGEDHVWKNVSTAGDYPGGRPIGERGATEDSDGNGKAYADYCFGRMMKTGIAFTKDSVTVDDFPPRKGYQSWCRKYHTYGELLNTAIKSLDHDKKDK